MRSWGEFLSRSAGIKSYSSRPFSWCEKGFSVGFSSGFSEILRSSWRDSRGGSLQGLVALRQSSRFLPAPGRRLKCGKLPLRKESFERIAGNLRKINDPPKVNNQTDFNQLGNGATWERPHKEMNSSIVILCGELERHYQRILQPADRPCVKTGRHLQ